MTLRRFAPALTPTARTGSALALLAMIGLGIATANPEAVVARNFTAALETAPKIAAADPRTLVSGSEAYWLAEKRVETSDAAIEPATWSAPVTAGLSVGDRITVSAGKSERVLQVVAMSEVEAAPGAASTVSTAAPRQIAVTCRDLTTPTGRLVTFLVPAEAAPGTARSAHAL